MMIFLGLVAAYLTIFTAGFGLTLLIQARSKAQLSIVECCALSWIFGIGVVSILLWVVGIVVTGLTLQLTIIVACIGLAALGWISKKRTNSTLTVSKPPGLIEWMLSGLLFAEIVIIQIIASKHTLGWDGLLIWEAKARYAFFNRGAIPMNYFSDVGRVFTHPEYPLGIPLTETWLYLWMGEAHQFWVKTLFPIFYAACVVFLVVIASRITGSRWNGLVVGSLLAFIPFFVASPGGIVVGYADFPLGVVYLASLGYLLLWLKTERREFLWIFATCLVLLPWIKREGIILWLVLVVIGLWSSWRIKHFRSFLVSLGPSVVLIVTWRIYLWSAHRSPASDFAAPSLGLLARNCSRIPSISRLALIAVTDNGQWSIYWLVVAIAIVYLIVRWREAQNAIVALAVVVPILLYCATYTFSNWTNYQAHITSSFPRLLLQMVPAGCLAIAMVLPLSRKSGLS
jgi:hypothetical protein